MEKDYPNDFPKKNNRRARRRAQFQRFRNRARMIAKYLWHYGRIYNDEEIESRCSRLATTRTPHPRYILKGSDALSLQERKQNEKDIAP